MSETFVTAPNTTAPLSTSATMSYLRAPTEDETLVKALIKAAGAAFERFTNGNSLGSTAYITHFDGAERDRAKLELSHRPIISVEAVTRYDDAGVDTVVTDYLRLTGSHTLFRQAGWNWGDQRDYAGLSVEYTAGRTALDADIVAGLQAYVAWQYENRGDVNVELPEVIAMLWTPYVIRRVYVG